MDAENGDDITGFPQVMKSPEFWVFKIQELKSPEIGQFC